MGVGLAAVDILFHRCKIECSWYIKVPSFPHFNFNYTIRNCSFTTGNMFSKFNLSSLGSLNIGSCDFTSIYNAFWNVHAITVYISEHAYINVTIQNCNIINNTFPGFLHIKPTLHKAAIEGKVLVTHCIFENIIITSSLVTAMNVQSLSNSNKLAIVFLLTRFNNNSGMLIHFKQ